MTPTQLIHELSEALTAVTNMICPGGPPDAQGNEYFITFNDAECESRLARAAKVLAQVEETAGQDDERLAYLSLRHGMNKYIAEHLLEILETGLGGMRRCWQQPGKEVHVWAAKQINELQELSLSTKNIPKST